MFELTKISKTMDKFEQQFEDLDANSKYMEKAMDSSTAVNMPQTDVENLMSQIADENGLEFESNLNDIGIGKNQLNKPMESAANDETKELEDRLKQLQGI